MQDNNIQWTIKKSLDMLRNLIACSVKKHSKETVLKMDQVLELGRNLEAGIRLRLQELKQNVIFEESTGGNSQQRNQNYWKCKFLKQNPCSFRVFCLFKDSVDK